MIIFCIATRPAAKPLTTAKNVPLVIAMDVMGVPNPAVRVKHNADNAGTEKGCRIVDIVLVVDGEGEFVSFHVG